MNVKKSEITLNEKDAIIDLLESEKQLMSLYTTALFEGSGKSIRKTFFSNVGTVAENQYCLFNQLTTRGYCEVTPAQKQQIDSVTESFKKQKKQLTAN